MHKTSFIVIGAVASAVLSVGAAQAQAAGDWYVAAAGTVSEPRDTKGAIANAGAPGFTVRTANSFETGYGVQAAIGRQVGRFRLEGEIGFTRDKQDHYVAIAPPTGRIPADVEQDTLRAMVNGYVDLSDGSIQPFIGAGIGAARVDLKFVAARAPFPTEPPRELINDRDTKFAYQLMGGLAVPLTERLRLTAQYRWFDVGKFALKDVRGERVTRSLSGHNLDLGLRLAF